MRTLSILHKLLRSFLSPDGLSFVKRKRLVSSLRTYSPGGPFNTYAPAQHLPIGNATPNGHRLRLGLQGYLIPIAPLAFVPHRRTRSSWTPFMASSPLKSPQVVLLGLQDFTPPPGIPPTSPGPKLDSFPSKPYVLRKISPRTYLTGYGRSRPNKTGHHLGRRYYRGGWHPSYPPLIPKDIYTPEKPQQC
jgi:hypothetical protein